MLSFDEFKGKYPQFDAFSPKKKGHVNKSHQGRGMEATAAHFQTTKKHKCEEDEEASSCRLKYSPR
jgi:hypothetical protein